MTEQNKALDQEFLYKALIEICYRIERCGASPELTHAVSMVSDLIQAIGNKWNPSNNYALERVKSELGMYPACKGKNCSATDGISHSNECQDEHDASYIEDDIDRTAKRNHVITFGSEI